MNLEVERVVLRLREPLRTAWGDLTERVVLRVALDDGAGIGEAAPLEPYDGVPLRAVEEALVLHAEALREFSGEEPGAAVLEACRAACDLPEALAAVDLALWDRAGRREGLPVSALLASAPLARVPVSSLEVVAGARCVKVKVGLGRDRDVAAVRAARETVGPGALVRVDANGAWDVEEAVAVIKLLEPFDLELVEEPCHGVEALRAVRDRVGVVIAQDETEELCADVVCLKVGRCGGISGLLARASLARALGMDVVLGSAFDSPVGIAAAVHCAAALRLERHCGLATLEQLDAPVPEALRVIDGMIAVPTAPGLGG